MNATFMLNDMFGAPQLAALFLLMQRVIEELHSQRNTARLLQQGAVEVGRDYYPVVAVAHLAWIAALASLVEPGAPINILILAAFIALQPVRYWIIATLGPYWTHRIITLRSAPLVSKGPYRIVRHPNYLVTMLETFLLPAAFGAWPLALIMTSVWGAVLGYKMMLEDSALEGRDCKALHS